MMTLVRQLAVLSHHRPGTGFSLNAAFPQYSWTNKMHFMYSVYYELTASTCFKHYLLIIRRRCIINCYIAFVCLVAAKTQYTRNTPFAVYAAPPEDEQVVLETGRGCQFTIN
jgi:hypothetical protein